MSSQGIFQGASADAYIEYCKLVHQYTDVRYSMVLEEIKDAANEFEENINEVEDYNGWGEHMSLEIKVDPDAVKSLTAKARLVPNERIDQTLGELEELESTLSGWKGDSKSPYDSLHVDMERALTSTKELMNAMLAALDNAVDDFSKVDDEISSRFEITVENYTADEWFRRKDMSEEIELNSLQNQLQT